VQHRVVTLSTTMEADLVSGVIVVELEGLLSLHSAPAVRDTLLKCFAQAPDAVIVDVTRLRVENRSQLTVFPAALRGHGGPGVALLLCGANAELRELMDGRVLGDVTTHRDRTSALSAVVSAEVAGQQRLVRRMEATPAAPSQARQLVTTACREWGLEALLGPASLVISELVSNAVQHAGTDMAIRVARRGDFLHLSVQDGSRRSPRLDSPADDDHHGSLTERGRGLHLVATYTTAWGSNVSPRGKTVWATLRVPSSE
jgi:anti-sigma regulatory factor (Ser/Thr protein kinase)/anti-anti-sigma regulatory factor